MKRILVAEFGKDHWSLLAYVESICVDTVGSIGEMDKRRLRCNPARHRLHAVGFASVRRWEPGYGTRLRGFWRDDDTPDAARQLPTHDDWDCLNDLEAAGLLEVLSEANGFVRMTDMGMAVAGRLRAHKASGGVFATFTEAA